MSAVDISIMDGQLWQWDVNRRISVPSESTLVNFSVMGGQIAYGVEPEDEIADIPNLLLQQSKMLECWASNGERTLAYARLKIMPRSKPSDYLYTSTEIATVSTLIESALSELSYNDLTDLPDIEGVTVSGSLTMEDFGVTEITDNEIYEIVENTLYAS